MLSLLLRPRGFLIGLFVMCLWSLSGAAFAYGQSTEESQKNVNCSGPKQSGAQATNSGRSFEEACMPVIEQIKASYTDPYYGTNKAWITTPVCTQGTATSGGCSGSFRCGGAGICQASGSGPMTTTIGCKMNSTKIGTQCMCNKGYTTFGNSTDCEPHECVAGTTTPSTQQIANSSVGSICDGGCVKVVDVKYKGSDGKWWGGSSGRQTGGFCLDTPEGAGADANNAPDPVADGKSGTPSPCAAGMCSGTFNGGTVCHKCDVTSAPGASTGASAPSGGAAPPLPGAPPGATSSQDNTTCSGSGSCTTTTTYYDSSGGEVGTISKEQSEGSFCAENPTSSICKASTITGACAAISCDGDAVQCAIAKEQAKRNCELWDAAPSNHPGVLAANGQSRPDGHPGADPESSSIAFSTVIDTSNGLGGGNCPSDTSISIAGHSLSVPFSKLCPHLASLGMIVQAFAMLAAAFIVFRS